MSQETLRNQLRIFFQGDEVPGFIVYGLAPRDTFVDGVQLRLAPAVEQVRQNLLHGEWWAIQLCEVAISEWPSQQRWPKLLEQSLREMVDKGAKLAWIGAEGLPFADPPWLFSAEAMSGGVLAWMASDGSAHVDADLDSPISPVGDDELDALRHIGAGLADAD